LNTPEILDSDLQVPDKPAATQPLKVFPVQPQRMISLPIFTSLEPPKPLDAEWSLDDIDITPQPWDAPQLDKLDDVPPRLSGAFGDPMLCGFDDFHF
jgi:hypothetical protein